MGGVGAEYAAKAVTFMGTSPSQVGPRLTDRLTDANALTSPPRVQAVDSDSLPFRHNALQALLAFSSLHEQIRQHRSRNQGRSGAASPHRSEDVFDTEQFVLDEVLQLVAERALAISGADGVAIALAEGDAIICRASAGVVAPDARARLDPNLGFSGACFRTGGIVRCDDVENDPRVNLQACRRLGTRSMVAVPLCAQHSVIGLLEAFSCDAYAFNDSDVRSLNLLAELILAALKPEEPEQEHRLNDAPVNPPTIETSQPVELAQPLEPVMEAISDTQAKDYEAEHGEASEPALFGEYEKTEPSRPGLLVVTIVVIFAALFAGTLGWKIRSKTQAATKPAVTEQAKIPASVMLPPANSNQVSVQSPDGTGAPIVLPPEARPAEALRGKFSVLPQVTGVRHWSSSDASTVAIDLQDPVQYEAHRLSSPERIYFDLHDTTLASGLSGKIIEVGDTLLVRVRIAQPMAGVTRVVLETKGASNFSVSLEPNPYRLVVQVRGMESSQSQSNKIDLFPPVGRAEKNKGAFAAGVVANGENTQLRAHVSKFRIVLDAGHGGWDLGTVGRRGLLEKDVVLEIVQRLGRLLESRLGSEVVYTRNNDNYVTLDQRTHLANRTQADMFVSIHANYSDLSSARGVETYYTDFFSSPGSREIEKRENGEAKNTVAPTTLSNVGLQGKIEESRRLAASIQRALYGKLSVQSPTIRDRGVKEASFVVLTGTSMPSVLAEVSFVSSPTDEQNLESSTYRQQIAEALYKGIALYAAGPRRLKMASASGRSMGK